jgi:hypothetical protein
MFVSTATHLLSMLMLIKLHYAEDLLILSKYFLPEINHSITLNIFPQLSREMYMKV